MVVVGARQDPSRRLSWLHLEPLHSLASHTRAVVLTGLVICSSVNYVCTSLVRSDYN